METQSDIKTTLNILSLEDSQYDFEIIRELLIDSGIDLKMDRVENKQDFESLLQKQKYDIILADYNLPQYNAYLALQKSIEINSKIPFIVVSGSIGEERAIELIRQGAVDYVLKDNPEKLPLAVHRALQEAKEKEARKVAEMALRENELRFKQVIECSGVWIWEVDTDGLFTYVSPMEENILGYKTEDLLGKKHFYDSFAPEIKAELKKAAFKVFSEKGVFTNLENANIHKDGHIVILSTSGSPLLDEKGNLLGYRGADTDITQRKQAEEEIKKINEELEQRVLDRTLQLETINKELEAFSYSVSHDLRSPLRSIDSFSNLLLKNYLNLLDEQGKDYFQRVLKASRRMGLLIDDLMKLARCTRGEIKREITNLSTIAASIVEELKAADPERNVTVIVQPGMIANVDSNLIENALQNLFANAWKYSKYQTNAKIEFGSRAEDGNTVYYVRDNGVGFEMKYVDKLFGAFQRLHSEDEFEGTGIGLATVSRIIHRHGGTIRAEGAVNAGATFYFTLRKDEI